jgi:hypothetical protein
MAVQDLQPLVRFCDYGITELDGPCAMTEQFLILVSPDECEQRQFKQCNLPVVPVRLQWTYILSHYKTLIGLRTLHMHLLSCGYSTTRWVISRLLESYSLRWNMNPLSLFVSSQIHSVDGLLACDRHRAHPCPCSLQQGSHQLLPLLPPPILPPILGCQVQELG